MRHGQKSIKYANLSCFLTRVPPYYTCETSSRTSQTWIVSEVIICSDILFWYEDGPCPAPPTVSMHQKNRKT